jgi:hypothetical protein
VGGQNDADALRSFHDVTAKVVIYEAFVEGRLEAVNSLICHVSTCFRIGPKFRCIRSTPTEMQSMSKNDFECFASTGVNTPVTMSLNSGCPEVQTSSNRTSGHTR